MSDGTARKKTLRPNKVILRRTLVLLAVCGIAAFVILALKLYEVQITNHDYYEKRALDGQLREATITASRGTIYDANGKILAMSASAERVFISPAEMVLYDEDPAFVADGLSAILGVDRDIILQRSERTDRWDETVMRKVESEEATLVREFISSNKLKSVHLTPDSKRYYPNASLAAQIIGFVGLDNDGLDGLENRYNSYLTGVNGRIVRLKNAKGTDLLFTDFEDYYDAQDGNNIALTIDTNVQYLAEKHLAQAIEDYDVQKGATVLVMNAKTGAILANASYNNFDPNDYQRLSEKEEERIGLIEDEQEREKARSDALFRQWRNKSLSDTYEPGSVFKAITLAMALEENLIREGESFNCGGSMEIMGYGDRRLNCWHKPGHGSQTLSEAIQHSCNIAIVNIGFRVGAQKFYDYAEAFGLFDKTGFDNSAEGRSQWWTEEVFADPKNQSQLATACFGQRFNITPIQMITAFAATINGGNLMKPYVVQQITDCDGNVVMAAEPTVVRQVVSAATSAQMREILEDVVKTGTGKNAQAAGYRVGGKTGTTVLEEVVAPNGEIIQPKEYITSFCGFAPADDPEIIILVLLDTPNQVTNRANNILVGGGAMAAPVVGNMIAEIMPYLGVSPQYTEEEMKDLNISVPRLTSRSVEEAKELLAEQGFEVVVAGEGATVTDQRPFAHKDVVSGTRVIIYAGEEPPKEAVEVPDLSGKSYAAAKQALEDRGLFIRTTGAPKSDGNATVSIQSVYAGTDTSYGTVVEVTLIDRDAVERL